MLIACEIVLKSYLPLELEEGMLFVNRISVGVIEPYIELFELKEIPEDMDEFMSKNGAPVELFIIDEDENIIAEHDEIGCWWDEEEDEFYEITLNDINLIINEYEGFVDVYFEEESPLFYDDKIILSLIEDN